MGYLPYNAAKLTRVSCGLVKDCRPHHYLYPITKPPEETEDPPLSVVSLIFIVTHRVTQGSERMRMPGEVKQGAQCACLWSKQAKGQPDRVTRGNTRLLRSGRSKLGEGQNC